MAAARPSEPSHRRFHPPSSLGQRGSLSFEPRQDIAIVANALSQGDRCVHTQALTLCQSLSYINQ